MAFLTRADRLQEKLDECHRVMLLMAEDWVIAAKLGDEAPLTTKAWLDNAEMLRAMVKRQKEPIR